MLGQGSGPRSHLLLLFTVLPTGILAIIQPLFSVLIRWYVRDLLHSNPHSNFLKFGPVLLPKQGRVSQ